MRAWLTVGALAAAVAAHGATATAAASGDTISVRTSGATEVVHPATGGATGTTIRLADASARATIELSDGSTLRIVGPAALRVVESTAAGTRIELAHGIVADARVRGVPVEIQSGHGASFVLQNARGWARVVAGDSVTFHRRSGEYARVHHGDRTYDLGTNSWRLHVSATAEAGPVRGNAGPAGFSRHR